MIKKFKFTAFTLAEVLIVLGILGIVAEMTIPTMMRDFQTKVTITSVKKAFSTLNQAYTMAVTENGTPDQWNLIALDDPTGMANLNSIMSKYLKVIKNCGTGTGCFPDVSYKNLNNNNTSNVNQATTGTKLMLADGSLVFLRHWSPDCSYNWSGISNLNLNNICGFFSVDINGFKPPNKHGVDYFVFLFTKYGVIPNGSPDQTAAYSFTDACNRSKGDPGGWYNGASCAAWVIYNENTDYLKSCGPTLGWGGITSCN